MKDRAYYYNNPRYSLISCGDRAGILKALTHEVNWHGPEFKKLLIKLIKARALKCGSCGKRRKAVAFEQFCERGLLPKAMPRYGILALCSACETMKALAE